MTGNKNVPWGLLILILFSLTAMSLLSGVDYEWTLWLNHHQIEFWGNFTNRTLADGDPFGGSDPGIIFALVMSVGYFCSYPGSPFPRLQPWRPYLGFVFFSALVTGLGLVHSLKWMVGRARPYLVVRKGLPFTHWFESGPQFVSDGIFFGSMPSGHTATAILMLTLAYILAADRTQPLRVQFLGWVWGALTLVYAAGMAIGRSMTLHHWLSDGTGIILLDWIAIHLIFFMVLKIPRQVQYLRVHGRYPQLPRYWELQLLWRLLVLTLAVMAVVIGIKAMAFQKAPFLGLMLLPAVPMVAITGKNLKKTYLGIMVAFTPDPSEKPGSTLPV
ncbi:MAG: phosphatase PAP2 family protein [bacterium]